MPPPKQRTPGANGTNLETPGHARVRSTTYVTPRQLFGKKTSKPLHSIPDRDRFSRAVDRRARNPTQRPRRTLHPRCLTTQGAATRPTALAPGPQRPGRPHCWRNGWRNGWQVTAPPRQPAASPAELGGGALPAALPDGGVWLADGSSESWRAPMGVGQAATRRAARGGHLRLSPPRRCSSPPHPGCPRSRQSPPTHLTAPHEPATADHHGRPR